MLPQTYESLKIKIQTELSEASFLSFTTDIRTNSKTKTSYLSLTAHWLNESFEYKHRALHCKEIKGSHTGFNIYENIKEMLENWGINMNRIHVFLRDNAFNMKAGMLMLESSSAPCFIHTLQLIIKDSLFTESNISVLIAKARQTVGHFNHSSTACEKQKKIQVALGSSVSLQKALLLVQDVETRWNLTYLMLKRLEKLKTSVQNYVANNNFKPENVLTADEWKLVSLLNELLEPFYIVTQKCSKNNALLSSVIPHAAVLKKFFNHKANNPPGPDQSSSTTLAILAENIEEVFERRFYTTNNSSRINLHDNDLFLLTTAVDPRYRLDFFSDNLRQKVVRILKSQVKYHSCRQSGQVPLIPLNKPKAQIPTNDIPKNFCHSILHLNRKEVKKLMKVSRKIQLIRKLRQKLRLFWLKKIYLLKKLKKLKSCLGGTQIRKNTLILPGLQEGIFRHHHLLFILKGYFQKLVTCTNKS